MNNLKVIFMGTPEFSLPVLEGLNSKYNVVMVVCQPDKPSNRGVVQYSPVKDFAIKNNIKVFQPVNVKNEYHEILSEKPDLIVTCAYGQIIPKEILDYPKYGCINVHGSLLPRLRGGAPIHHAIINGDKETGITIMYMDKKMDAGDIISQRSIEIKNTDNLDSIYSSLSILGSELLIETLPSIINGTNNRIKQNENEVTFGYNISKEDELINFNDSAVNIFNKVRGLCSIPGASCYYNGKRLKIYEVEVTNKLSKDIPGKIVEVNKDSFVVTTKDYLIKIKDIKLEGKKRCMVSEYLNGIHDKSSLLGGILTNE